MSLRAWFWGPLCKLRGHRVGAVSHHTWTCKRCGLEFHRLTPKMMHRVADAWAKEFAAHAHEDMDFKP